MVLELIIAATLLSSLAGLSGGALLMLKERFTRRISTYLVSFATGAILAAALLDMIPEGLEMFSDIDLAFILILSGIVLFFVLEKLLLWHHHHHHHDDARHGHHHDEPKGYLIAVGDSLHNFVDGIILAASFLIDISLGVVTTIAILVHEIPQEMGDFGAMLHLGFSRARTIIVNVIAALASLVGAVLTFFLAQLAEGIAAPVLFVAAGTLIYIAASDLIPELHKERSAAKSALQLIALLVGVLLIWAVKTYLE
jgi:zinc and cadmium transporter